MAIGGSNNTSIRAMTISDLQTERLYFRPFTKDDTEALFKLDSNPNVHRFLGNDYLTSIEQVYPIIESVQNQYLQNGIGRYMTFLKDTNEPIGWSGIKFITEEPENGHIRFYDIGYRLMEEHWRKGYGLEAALFWRDYAFTTIQTKALYASAHIDNAGSNAILQKIGMTQCEIYNHHNLPCYWYELKK